MPKLKKSFPPVKKVVLSPPEFAALFGRHYTWAYRQIKAGKIRVVTEIGRTLIPRSEVDRILGQVPELPNDQSPPPDIPHNTNPSVPPHHNAPVSVVEASSEHPVMAETVTAPVEERLWTTEQAADFLQVSPRTVFNLRKVGLPHIYLGGTVRFFPQRMKDYLAANPNLSLHRLRQIIRRKARSL